ncbi:hypothetical protein GGH15_001204 [Coemansia sp. RSA 562]|nr:hypothetical protein GGH15_001204 [Coemansia sp. RSA 562]
MYVHSRSIDDGLGDDSNAPRPSQYQPSLMPRQGSTLMGEGGTRSSSNAAGPSFQGSGMPQYAASGPQPYSSPSGAYGGPGGRPPPQGSVQGPPQTAAPNNASGPQAYASHPYPGGARPPPVQQQQQQQQQQPLQPQYTQSMASQSIANMISAATPYPGASSEVSSIYSGPHPGNGHTSSTINTTSGAYYAPTTNSSSSAIPEGYGYPQQHQQSYQQQQQPQQQYQQQPYQQQQQPRPPGANESSLYTATSYSPTQGPAFNSNSGQVPVNPGYAPSIGGPTVYGRPPYSQSNYAQSNFEEPTSRVGTAGKLALGALAAGALAYGVHGYRENSSEEEKKEQQRKQWLEDERVRRENDARRRREEDETRRRNEYEQWRREENERYFMQQQQQQQMQHQMPQPQRQHSNAPSIASHHTGRIRSDSRASSLSSHRSDGFHPPDPFGRAPYTFSQRDVRHPDPSRSSDNSKTAETYPELWQKPSDTTVKIGTILALKHVSTGQHLRTDRSHSTESGSNQQLAYAHGWAVDELDRWQVLPANTETPTPGSIISYGMQVRLRHFETGRHLHSHYGFVEPTTGQNEVTVYGDQTQSDENDHWVVERWGSGAYGQTWKATDPVVLRHYVSGMVLCSRDLPMTGDIQPVMCSGAGHAEDDKWRVVLDC